jgi:hypothetical protein
MSASGTDRDANRTEAERFEPHLLDPVSLELAQKDENRGELILESAGLNLIRWG